MKLFHQLKSCWHPTFTFHLEPERWFFSNFTEGNIWFSPALLFLSCLPLASPARVFLENNTSFWFIAPQSYKARWKKIVIFNTTLRPLSSDTYSLQLYFKIQLLVLINIFRTIPKLSRLWFVSRIPDEMLFVAFLRQWLAPGWFRSLLAYVVCYR